MRRFRILTTVIMVFSLLLSTVQTTRAEPIPPLPSAFHGLLVFYDNSPIAGDTIYAWVPGAVTAVASAPVTSYMTNLVYAISVPGDNSDTVGVKEGGAAGDLVTFIFNGRQVATAPWVEGSSVELNIHPPQALPGGPYAIMADETNNLTGSANDGGSDASLYEWDLDGDDAYDDATGIAPDYSNSTPGTYTIGLRVTDAQGGIGTASTTVFVYTLGGISGQEYDGNQHPVTATGIQSPYTYNVTYDGGTTAPTNAGTYVVVVHIMNGAVEVTSITTSLVIAPKAASVTPNAAGKIYGDSDPALNGTLSGFLGGDGVTAVYSRTAGETVAGSPYTISAVLSPAGVLGNYAITYNTANFTISTRAITVNAEAKTKVYGEADPALTYTFTGTLIGTDAFSGELSRAVGEDVGNYAILQNTLSLGTNYAITYNGANLSITARPITITADPLTKTYGAPDPTLTYTYTGTLIGTDAFSGALSREPGSDVGVYAILQNTLTLGSNYAITYNGANLTITPKGITVTANSGQTKVYGEADPVFLYTPSEAVSFTGALSRVAGSDVGSYAITQGNLSAGSNYTITFVPANFSITARPITVTADPQTKVYGDADPALTYTYTGTLVGADVFTGALSREPGSDVGTYAILQNTLTLGSNYAITYNGADLMIIPKGITVTADSGQTKVYGEADPVFTYTSSEVVSFTGALSRVAGSDVGVYAITQGNLSAGGNYTITFVPANFSITARPITVTADPQTKVYGNADPALTYLVTSGSVVSGDSFSGALSRAAGENVGPYAISQNTLTLGSNYAITYAGDTLTITLRPIEITADNKSKIIGTGDPALTWSITGGSLAFSDAVSGSLVRVAGETIGHYAINQGTVAINANYNLTFVPGDFEITGVQHSLVLQPGWNLVSFAIHPASTLVTDIFAPIDGSFDLVYAWDASVLSPNNWLKYDNIPMSSDNLVNLDEGMGFWIHITALTPVTLTVSGTLPTTTSIPLYITGGGWNLIGYPSDASAALPGALTSLEPNYSLVFSYRALDTVDPWKMYDRLAPAYASDLTEMAPGWAYWIKVSATDILEVAY